MTHSTALEGTLEVPLAIQLAVAAGKLPVFELASFKTRTREGLIDLDAALDALGTTSPHVWTPSAVRPGMVERRTSLWMYPWGELLESASRELKLGPGDEVGTKHVHAAFRARIRALFPGDGTPPLDVDMYGAGGYVDLVEYREAP